VATALMILPVALIAVSLIATAHNLWPRFFFFAAGFAVLMGIRGVFATAELVTRRHSLALATALCLLLATGSAYTVAGAWRPKQDYEGALQWVLKEKGAGDAVVALDMSQVVYDGYLRAGFLTVRDAVELQRIESRHTRTFVLYSFPSRVEVQVPDVWQRLQQAYRPAAEFPGSLGGGAIHVMVRP
jgi:hypothetical protein